MHYVSLQAAMLVTFVSLLVLIIVASMVLHPSVSLLADGVIPVR